MAGSTKEVIDIAVPAKVGDPVDMTPVAPPRIHSLPTDCSVPGRPCSGTANGPGGTFPVLCAYSIVGTSAGNCAARRACVLAERSLASGDDDTWTEWYSSRVLTLWGAGASKKAMVQAIAGDGMILAGADAAQDDIGARLMITGQAPFAGRVSITQSFGAVSGSKVMNLGVGACQAVRIRSRVTYRFGHADTGAGVQWVSGHTGCSLEAGDAELRLGSGETGTVDVSSSVSCPGDMTLSVRVYGMGSNGEVKLDGEGVTGTVTLDGRDATQTPVMIDTKGGVRTPLPIRVNVNASPTASAGKWSGSVIILATPA